MDKISIIIPVYNESASINIFLERLAPLKNHCEIFFVDGGSGDDTVQRIKEYGGVVVSSAEKGRARQMNYGASFANGEILWFLHADSLPPATALDMIRRVLDRGYKIGCFPLRFDSSHPLMFLNAFMSNLRVRIRNIAFGDQGIFIRKDLFEDIGGYAAIPLMEDYRLSMDVTNMGLHIGMAAGKIVTSERRYLKNGRLKTIRRMWALQRSFRCGADIEEIAQAYDNS
ncbi:MAG: TIGR04283 family arsenosugar biosynthesis glycosyltransferase [Oscillospiraceae bacterium]|jgi:rSAM/selenodomain-associated transferase 2|nr:TIGR04283 family arsenosugar biosynthesis glycosyltransferase [Oscillospiraceae bacterium]